MRLRTLPFYLMILLLFHSCKKEYSFESGFGTLRDTAGICFNTIVHGSYKKDVVLNNDNYMLLPVNVSRLGRYSINSDTINGYWFSGSGLFTHKGMDTVKLFGQGEPIQYSQNIFSVVFGTNCPIYSEVLGTPSIGNFNCTIDGEEKTYSANNRGALVSASYSNIINIMASKDDESILLTVQKFPGPIKVGIYNSTVPGNFIITCYYAKNVNTPLQTTWFGGTGKLSAFSISINQITIDRVKGIFSGTIENDDGSIKISITDGIFDVPFY